MRKPRAIGIYLGDAVTCAAWVAETGCTSMIANEDGLVLWPVHGAPSKSERLREALSIAGADVTHDAIAIIAPGISSPAERAGWFAAAQEAGIGNAGFPTRGICGAVGLLESLGALASAPDSTGRTVTISAADTDEITVCGCRSRVLQVRERNSTVVPPAYLKPDAAMALPMGGESPLPRDAFEAHWSGSSSSAPPDTAPPAATTEVDHRIIVGERVDSDRSPEAIDIPCGFHPLEAIARGGAHIANHTVQIFDLAARPLGASVVEDGERVWRSLVPAGCRLPARLFATFASATPEQASLSIPLTYRGDDGEETLAGILVIDGLQQQDGEAAHAEITLDLFVNGRVAAQCRSGESHCHPTFRAAGSVASEDSAACFADARFVSVSPPDSSPWEVFLPTAAADEGSTPTVHEASEAPPPSIDYLESRPQTFRRSRPAGLSPFKQDLIYYAGLIVFSGLGLAIGYYILIWLRPELNTLELNLPGLGGGPLGRP